MSRLTATEALELHSQADLQELGRSALEESERRHPGPMRTYIVDRNINYSNVCCVGCKFCNFCRPAGDSQAYVLTYDELLAKIDELVRLGGQQILLQGGLHPDLPLEWYLQMLRCMKSHYPQVHVHGFSPPEIVHFSNLFGKSVRQVIGELVDAGLDTIPGGGAEILVDRVRQELSSGKCSAGQWLDVMAEAHKLGLRTTATMMFGHIETAEERIEHLLKLRQLQDETGGFTAFICWTFQPAGTKLAEELKAARGGPVEPASVQEYLRMLALARLFLDNFDNLQASWVTQGPAVGQVALKFGANDFGSLMLEENVVASAGTSYRLTEHQLRTLIEQAGYVPAKRDCYYTIVERCPDKAHA